jgi:Ni/Fe-hydrogenase subunit HybB-like protein
MEMPTIYQIISALLSGLALILSTLSYMNKKTKDEKEELAILKTSAALDHTKIAVIESQMLNDRELLNKLDDKLDKILGDL